MLGQIPMGGNQLVAAIQINASENDTVACGRWVNRQCRGFARVQTFAREGDAFGDRGLHVGPITPRGLPLVKIR